MSSKEMEQVLGGSYMGLVSGESITIKWTV